jgi:hypothetical protein
MRLGERIVNMSDFGEIGYPFSVGTHRRYTANTPQIEHTLATIEPIYLSEEDGDIKMNARIGSPHNSQVEKVVELYDHLSEDALRAIKNAYAIGRADTLAQLGLEETDLPQAEGPTAWAI